MHAGPPQSGTQTWSSKSQPARLVTAPHRPASHALHSTMGTHIASFSTGWHAASSAASAGPSIPPPPPDDWHAVNPTQTSKTKGTASRPRGIIIR
jgi:hypothetical protein